jgi:hypothetical protein
MILYLRNQLLIIQLRYGILLLPVNFRLLFFHIYSRQETK